MSRLYNYLFGNRHEQEMETKLQLLERKIEDAEIMGRYRDAKLVALLDRIECLETEFTRQKTTLLQQKTALEEQLVHARRTRSSSTLQPLQPITDTPKPTIASADVFLVDPETAQPLTACKFADCIAPDRRGHGAEASAILLDEPFFKNKMKASLEAYGHPAPPAGSLYRCDTMSRINNSGELGNSAMDMYQSNEKGQMAYCLRNNNPHPDVAVSPRASLGALRIGDAEKRG